MLEYKEMEFIDKAIEGFSQSVKEMRKTLKVVNRRLRRFAVQANRRKPLIHKGKKP